MNGKKEKVVGKKLWPIYLDPWSSNFYLPNKMR